MTCQLCNKPYKKFHTTCGAPLWKKQCSCKRHSVTVKPEPVYNIRSLWRDEVGR